MHMTIIETERLIIRHGAADDFPEYLSLVQDPAATTWGLMGYQRPQTLTEAETSFKDYYLSGEYAEIYSIRLKDSGEMIGILNIEEKDWTKTFEIGYTLHSQYWHHGYATEAAQAALTYLFKERQAPYVFAIYVEGNQASTALLERLGMTFEGIWRNTFLLRGQLTNEGRYGMTAEEYAKKN